MWFGEFIEFLNNANVMNVALAFVVSTNVNQIVTSIVANLLNPLLRTVVQLETFTVTVNKVEFRLGNILNSVLSFGIILFLLFWVFRLK